MAYIYYNSESHELEYISHSEEEFQLYGFTGHEFLQRQQTEDIRHPFQTFFEVLWEYIDLDANVAHLIACGENRFDLIEDEEQRRLAKEYFAWFSDQEYWWHTGNDDPSLDCEPEAFQLGKVEVPYFD